jgi:hypothetical protein
MIEETKLTLRPLLPLQPVEVSRYRECNATIKGGLATFYAVGDALREVREKRYYREEFPTFESYCSERWGIKRAQASRLIGSAEVIDNLSPNGQLPTSERQARELVPYEAEVQQAIWNVVTSTAPKGTRITAAGHIKSVAIQLSEIVNAGGMDDGNGEITPLGQLLKAHITEEVSERLRRQTIHIQDRLGDSDEWLTADSPFLKAARNVLGGKIDLDPASCAEANAIIRAKKFYTKADNGLSHPWPGNVWLNPPFSFPLVEAFVDYTAKQYETGTSKAIVMLTNNSSGSAWGQSLLKRFLICYPAGRVPFWRIGREGTGGTRDDQMFTYLGLHEDLFIKEFGPLGTVMRAVG